MRRRRLKILWRRLHELQQQTLTRDALLLKLGAAKKEAGRAYHGVEIQLPDPNQPVTPESFTFSLRRDKLRTVRRREGRYLLRSNLPNEDPATLWQYYIRLTEIEQAFKELKHDLPPDFTSRIAFVGADSLYFLIVLVIEPEAPCVVQALSLSG